MKKVCIVLMLFAFVAIQAQIGSYSTYLDPVKIELSKQYPVNRTINLVFHGHSVPSGYFVTPDVRTLEAYPYLTLKTVKENFPYAIVNSITTSIGGENAVSGAARFENDVLIYRPDVLFIDYALNDRFIGLASAKTAWKSMIEKALAKGIKVILLTPTPDLGENILDDNAVLEQHSRQIRQLAVDYNVGLVDSYDAFKKIKQGGGDLTAYMSQGNHPNGEGHKVVKNLIAKYLLEQTDEGGSVTLVNFNDNGQRAIRFDMNDRVIDAHEGKISYFDGVYYLYGTSYDCGFEINVPGSPFCGFKVYSSPDLLHWTDEGFLFNAQTAVWQERCNGSTHGGYRPRVVYNKKNNQYVLWINTYDNSLGYRVLTSSKPIGPFTEISEPTLAFNSSAPAGGLNNGDHDIFVDSDDIAYIAYTDVRAGGKIVIEKLNADYTSGTGESVNVTASKTESPALMKRNGKYYILYSDPDCVYCVGSGTSYKTATSILGTWSAGTSITANSCGGEPSFVSTIELENNTIYLYGSDLWNVGAKNQALAGYYWTPLKFTAEGAISPIDCAKKVTLPIEEKTTTKVTPENLDCTSGIDGFTNYWDIRGSYQRGQIFVATRTGTLSAVSFGTYKFAHPDQGLTIAIYATANSLPTGTALFSTVVPANSIGWAPNFVTVNPNIPVEAGVRYAIVVKTTSAAAQYGMLYNDKAPYEGGGAIYSSNGGATFIPEANRTLMFQTFIDLVTAENNTLKAGIDIYPNPAKQQLNIYMNGMSGSSEVKIFDNMGREVLSQHVSDAGNQNVTVDISSLTNGIYIVKLDNNGTVLKTTKMVKQ